MTDMNGISKVEEQLSLFNSTFAEIKCQVEKVFVGQQELVSDVLSAFFAGGHVLLEGVPGIGKTLLAKSLSQAMNLSFERIQCTPDLMPADIVGYQTLVETEGGGHKLQFKQGPVIAHYVLVDEINRATPKTQAALLQAMQEGQVTIGRETFYLPQPNIIIATQNPIEHSGTYPLPESEIDRFMVKLNVKYPEDSDYRDIIKLTTSAVYSEPNIAADVDLLLDMKGLVRKIHVVDEIIDYAVGIVKNTQPENSSLSEVRENIVLGAGPRAVQALILMGKVKAVLDGRTAISKEDVTKSAYCVLRHRLISHFSARFTNTELDNLIDDILAYAGNSLH